MVLFQKQENLDLSDLNYDAPLSRSVMTELFLKRIKPIEKNKRYSITFDIDWAPDCAIQMCLEMLSSAGVKATFFTTHQTDLNKEIVRNGHLLGIHPNFLANSSHGSSVKQVIEFCLKLAPNSWCMRSHGLVQSSPMFKEIFSSFKQLKLDASLFIHKEPMAKKITWALDEVKFDRIIYNWADDAEFVYQNYSGADQKFFGELTVFGFHPIHIFLNSSNGSEYTELKESINGKSLSKLKKSDIEKFQNKEIGVRSFFESILFSNEKNILLGEI